MGFGKRRKILLVQLHKNFHHQCDTDHCLQESGDIEEAKVVLEPPATAAVDGRSSVVVATSDAAVANEQRRAGAMTRKTRTRRPRVQSLQSGYCEICRAPYNSIEDHVQSKRHQKLIGDDAGYISINGFLNQDAGMDTFLNLNIDTLDSNGLLEGEVSPRGRKRNISRRTRAASVCDRMRPSPLSPANSEIVIGHHHLRSRRNINYMTPPLDDDSLPEKPDLSPPPIEYPNNRELRSSSRLLQKVTDSEEVWNSGRPKRSCIKQKRSSTEERIIPDKAYYKVEVLSGKLRSSQTRDVEVSKQLRSPRSEEEEKEKGLIVKFKKLRNSELVQLNNEATNFLFPKKDESSEEEDIDADGANTTVSSGKNDSTLLLTSEDEESKMSNKFKVEDDASMDSVSSETKRKKRRRTHAEAFIMDNQKYYKFETPGSSSCRLRYHGSWQTPSAAITTTVPLKSPKNNGDVATKIEKDVKTEPAKEFRLNVDDYKFTFERVPRNEQWYTTFRRQDKGEMRYNYYSDHFYWDAFILPYQMGPLQPLDPKVCLRQYNQVKKALLDPPSTSSSAGCTTPDPSVSNSTPSIEDGFLDEDSKISMATSATTSSTVDELKDVEFPKRRGRRPKILTLSSPTSGGGKNPRKSPRQHASTLAILSSLIQQRKRKSRGSDGKPILQPIPEETKTDEPINDDKTKPAEVVKSPGRKRGPKKKRKIDYYAIASKIEEEINSTLDEPENFEDIEIKPDYRIQINTSKVNVREILGLYDQGVAKEDERSTRRFFNGTPGRKPGRRKKKNKTGWPKNRSRRLLKKDNGNSAKAEDNEGSVVDSCSVLDSCDEVDDDNSTDSIKKIDSEKSDQVSLGDVNSVEENCDLNSDRVEQTDNKVLTNKTTNSEDVQYQPYVCVQKLNSDKVSRSRVSPSPKRTRRRQRRMPGSPKSPRMLRKPRGGWYRVI